MSEFQGLSDWKRILEEFGSDSRLPIRPTVEKMAEEIVKLRNELKTNIFMDEGEKLFKSHKESILNNEYELISHSLQASREEIAKLRAEKEQWEPEWKSQAEANAEGYNQSILELQASRAANARLRAAVEKLTCNSTYASIVDVGKEADYGKHDLSCDKCRVLINTDGKKELSLIKRAVELLRIAGCREVVEDLVEAFGLGK